MPLFCFPGQKANTNIYHSGDGFYYHLTNSRPNRCFTYLRCIHYGTVKYQCPGTAKALMNQNSLFHLRDHSHPSNVLYHYVLALKKDILTRVKSGDQSSFMEIAQQEGQKYALEVRAQVGMGSFVNRLNAVRSKLRPPVPRSLGVLGACLVLPEYEYLTRCLHVPDSLYAGMCGNMCDGTLSLVFISPEMKDFMETRSMIFADGTKRKMFRKPRASQIYVISAAWRFHAIVMARVIMLRRTQIAYETLIDYLRMLMPNFQPTSIKCDFEDAHINAWLAHFPAASVEGCLWHYNVAIYSMAKNKLGLYHLVKDEEEVASIIRSAGALPLLPTDEIESGLDDLGNEAREKGWMGELRSFFKYMAREWLPKVAVLSVAGSVHRTNNIAESTNRALNKEIKISNPSCYNVLRAFVATNEKYTIEKHTLALGLAAGRNRKISALRNDIRIRCLTTDLENGDISRLQFLHRASRSLQNVFNKVFK